MTTTAATKAMPKARPMRPPVVRIRQVRRAPLANKLKASGGAVVAAGAAVAAGALVKKVLRLNLSKLHRRLSAGCRHLRRRLMPPIGRPRAGTTRYLAKGRWLRAIRHRNMPDHQLAFRATNRVLLRLK